MGSDSSAEYDQLQTYYMKSAANNAVAAAFKAAKQPVKTEHRGIYVMSVLPQSPFKGKLALGDTITKLNGKSYQTADAYVNAIKSKKVGTNITLTYQHKGQTKQATAKLIRLPQTKRAGIGITLTENTAVTSDPKVTIDAGNIGGPSAGTMFALQIYTQITHQDLRGVESSRGPVRLIQMVMSVRLAGLIRKLLPQMQKVPRFSLPESTGHKKVEALRS